MLEDKLSQLPVYFGAELHPCSEPCWSPPADIYQTKTGWLIKYELAGVTTKDIEVTLASTTITINGCRRDWRQEDGCSQYAMEIPYSRFERNIELPCQLDRARLKIQWRDGILILSVLCPGEPS